MRLVAKINKTYNEYLKNLIFKEFIAIRRLLFVVSNSIIAAIISILINNRPLSIIRKRESSLEFFETMLLFLWLLSKSFLSLLSKLSSAAAMW